MFGIPHSPPSRLRILKSSRKIYLHQIAPGAGHRCRTRTQQWVSSMARGQRIPCPLEILQLWESIRILLLLPSRRVHQSWTRSRFYEAVLEKSFVCTIFSGTPTITLQKGHHSCSHLTLNLYCWVVGTEKVFNLALFGKHQVTSMMRL